MVRGRSKVSGSARYERVGICIAVEPGASYRLLKLVGDDRWRPNVTASLVLEYESVLKRNGQPFDLTHEDIDALLDTLCSQAGRHRLYFLWRPVAADPDDDLVGSSHRESQRLYRHLQQAGLS
jgi:hypothetical protein